MEGVCTYCRGRRLFGTRVGDCICILECIVRQREGCHVVNGVPYSFCRCHGHTACADVVVVAVVVVLSTFVHSGKNVRVKAQIIKAGIIWIVVTGSTHVWLFLVLSTRILWDLGA